MKFAGVQEEDGSCQERILESSGRLQGQRRLQGGQQRPGQQRKRPHVPAWQQCPGCPATATTTAAAAAAATTERVDAEFCQLSEQLQHATSAAAATTTTAAIHGDDGRDVSADAPTTRVAHVEETVSSVEFLDGGSAATTTTPPPAAAATTTAADSTSTTPAAAATTTTEHDELSDAEQSPGLHESTATNDPDGSRTSPGPADWDELFTSHHATTATTSSSSTTAATSTAATTNTKGTTLEPGDDYGQTRSGHQRSSALHPFRMPQRSHFQS